MDNEEHHDLYGENSLFFFKYKLESRNPSHQDVLINNEYLKMKFPCRLTSLRADGIRPEGILPPYKKKTTFLFHMLP